jgi:hypothetical protein
MRIALTLLYAMVNDEPSVINCEAVKGNTPLTEFRRTRESYLKGTRTPLMLRISRSLINDAY